MRYQVRLGKFGTLTIYQVWAVMPSRKGQTGCEQKFLARFDRYEDAKIYKRKLERTCTAQ